MSNATVTVQHEFVLQRMEAVSPQNLQSPVHLGPLDHISLGFVPIAAVFVYRQDSPNQEVIPLPRLRLALSRLLDYYPHLTGRIVVNPDDHSTQIEHLDAGAKLVSATCDQPLDKFEGIADDDKPGSSPRLIAANLPGGGNALLPPFDSTVEGLTRDAILTVQHTRFACGGVSIGFYMRHVICDAAGFFQLVRHLAEIYRGLSIGMEAPKLRTPPRISCYAAELHAMSFEERQEAQRIQPVGFKLTSDVQSAANDSEPPPVVGRLLRFSAEELRALKDEANSGPADPPVSTFIALTAHIFQCVYRARVSVCEAQGASFSEAVKRVPGQVLTPVNARGRFGLSAQYFPNCVYNATFALPRERLHDAPLSAIAAMVRDGIQVPNAHDLEQSLKWIAAQPDKRRVMVDFNYEAGAFFASQWNKFGMYRSAVLNAPPALMVQPFSPRHLYDGLMYVMGTEDELNQSADSIGRTAGALDVSIALSEPVWAALDQDTRFRRL